MQAEHLVLAAYTSLLLGCLMRDNPSNRAAILAALPNHSPRTLIRVLKAFLAFQKQVGNRAADSNHKQETSLHLTDLSPLPPIALRWAC